MRSRRLLLVGLGVAVALVGGFAVFRAVVEPDEPSSFYEPPEELPDGPPGTVIRDERVTGMDAGQRAWRVLYTSTGLDGQRIAVSGVVVAPSGEPPASGWPVIAWAHGTTGIVPRCAPSIDYPETGLVRVPELDDLVAGGAVVAVTDYPGLGTPGTHPYLVGESEGRAVLDSVRAAQRLLDGETSSTTAVYGHSQGGHAALWADQLAGSYAPELRLAGVAVMAPPTELGTLLTDDEGEAAGIVLTSLALVSWSETYSDTSLDDVVDPASLPMVRDLASRCIATTDEGFSVAPDVVGLEAGFLSTDPVTAPGWDRRLRENSPASTSRSVPLLIAQGMTDTLVRPEVTSAFVERQCAAGTVIAYHEYPGVGHFQVRAVAAPDVRDWLLARVGGDPDPSECRTARG